MPVSVRKRIKIFPGVYLNLGKKGISFTLGAKGQTLNVGSKGVYGNVRVPGSGVSYRKKIMGPFGSGFPWRIIVAVLVSAAVLVVGVLIGRSL